MLESSRSLAIYIAAVRMEPADLRVPDPFHTTIAVSDPQYTLEASPSGVVSSCCRESHCHGKDQCRDLAEAAYSSHGH